VQHCLVGSEMCIRDSAYALRDNGSGGTVFTPLTGAMNLTTMAEYFYVSDTDSSSGNYISQ
jgi:hypothetical protein